MQKNVSELVPVFSELYNTSEVDFELILGVSDICVFNSISTLNLSQILK